MRFPGPPTPEMYFDDLMSSRAAQRGQVIRRNIRDVEFHVGRVVFFDEMRRRGFRVYENAGQFVIFCNREEVRQVV